MQPSLYDFHMSLFGKFAYTFGIVTSFIDSNFLLNKVFLSFHSDLPVELETINKYQEKKTYPRRTQNLRHVMPWF